MHHMQDFTRFVYIRYERFSLQLADKFEFLFTPIHNEILLQKSKNNPRHLKRRDVCRVNVLIICGNKMPTRCNRGFYCRSYCLLNMFRAPLSPSSGAQEYYTLVAPCGIWCCSILQTAHTTLNSTPDQQLENHSTKYHR